MNTSLSGNIKGLLYLTGGTISLLYIHGWFTSALYYPMFAGALTAFIYGFIVTDAFDFIKGVINKFKKPNNN
jgi:hypothetical protein